MKKALFSLLAISIMIGQTVAQNNTFPGIGSVGIGTTMPLAKLHVTTISTNVGDNTASFSAPNIGGNFSHIHYGSTGDWYIRSANSSGRVMLQDLGGNVGVGTDIPTAKFEIVGSGFQFRIRHPAEPEKTWGLTVKQLDDLSGAIEIGGRNLRISSGWDKTLYLGAPEYTANGGKVIFPGGKIGIGTLSPQSKLDVSGANMVGLNVGGNTSSFQGADICIARSNTTGDVGRGAALQFNDTGSSSYNIIQGSSEGLQFYNSYNGSGWVERMRIAASGKLGLGTSDPWNDFHIKRAGTVESAIIMENTSSNKILQISNYGSTGDGAYWTGLSTANTTSINAKGSTFIMRADNGLIFSGSNTTEHMRITSTGKVGINTTTPDVNYELSVNGKIKTKEIKVTQLGWADYVFYKDYKLKPLSEIESFIKDNNHLPEVPSAAEVEKDGINLGEMDALLLKKIEELTLYMIEIKKENDSLKDKNKVLEERMKKLED